MSTNSNRIWSIEFLRTIFCLTVIFYHVVMGSLIPFTQGSPSYKKLSVLFANSGFVVECFFILSGFFLVESMRQKGDMPFLRFLYMKIRRLWPVFALSVWITHWMTNGVWQDSLIVSFFLQLTGLTGSFRGINWYVSAMFWSLVFYFLLLKSVKDQYRRNFIILLVSWAAYVLNMQSKLPMGFGREVVHGFFSLGLLRGIAGVGLGVLISEFVQAIKIHVTDRRDSLFFCFVSGLEFLASWLLIEHFYIREWSCRSHFIVVVAFAILLPCLVLNKGMLSRALNHKWLGVMGKYTFSMYVMQQAGFWILQESLWKNTSFVLNHHAACLVVSVAVPAFIGIAAYHLIEKPGAKLLDRIVGEGVKRV